ncbi:MAG: hypothetical protein HOH90_10130, partial [Candidatus Marinimicrobia bacterium]|nr:hypothetical protein [Candidatus Neomarinimicrobiota bacterium]
MSQANNKYSNHPIRRWLIAQSLDHSWRTIILSILATLMLGSGMQFFTIDDDMMKMMPKELDSKKSWDMIQDEFGSTEVIFISFGKSGKNIFNPNAMATLWDLNEALATSN